MKHEFDEFTSAYVEAALTDSTDADGATLSAHGIGELTKWTAWQMRRDCDDFRGQVGAAIDPFDPTDIARDFWLERNGRPYGGFWDADYPQPAATFLTRVARLFGPIELYREDDDGLIHLRRQRTRE